MSLYVEEQLEVAWCPDEAEDLDALVDCLEATLSNIRNVQKLGFKLAGVGNHSILLVKER